METPTPQQVLDLALPDNDANAATVRDYLVALTREVWSDGEGFSGKRPFGNSGWQGDFDKTFIEAGWVEGRLDADGWVEDVDSAQVDTLVRSAIDALAARPVEAVLAATEPSTDRNDRHDALVQAVVYHAEVGVDEHEHVVRTAAEMAAFLATGELPESAQDEPDFGIVVDRKDDRVRIIVADRVIAELDHDQAGNAGMDALEAAVLGAVRACGVEPTYIGPGETA